jgi:hypothetical protein
MASQGPKKNISKSECKSDRIKEDCNICAGEVSTRKIVQCPFCPFSACIACTSRFLMEIDDDQPRCMSPTCKKVWTYEFLSEKFDNTFHNKTYRDRRADLLLQQQKALLPGTQHLVLEKKRDIEINDKINDLLEENAMLKLLIKRNKDKINELAKSKFTQNKVEEKRSFTRACPRNNCRGFLSTALKCGTCEEWACKDCHEPKDGKDDPDHKCDPNTVETIKLLAQDTKACPSCATAIFKIHGCDQMYCTRCHTAFSWDKGTIERGVIHNPHYYEFQRAQNGGVAPRVAGDIRCGGPVNMWDIHRAIESISPGIGPIFNTIHRMMNHIQHIEIPRYPMNMGHDTLDTMRVNYLLGLLDEKTWLSKLKEKSKKQEKNLAINQVLTMLTSTIGDIFGNITTCKNKKQLDIQSKSFEELREFTNKALARIGHRFGNVVPVITDKWEFYSNSKHSVPKKKLEMKR